MFIYNPSYRLWYNQIPQNINCVFRELNQRTFDFPKRRTLWGNPEYVAIHIEFNDNTHKHTQIHTHTQSSPKNKHDFHVWCIPTQYLFPEVSFCLEQQIQEGWPNSWSPVPKPCKRDLNSCFHLISSYSVCMNRDVGVDLVPWTENPDRLQSGVPGVGQDLATKPPPPPPLMAQTSLVAQTVKNLPTMQETQVRSLGQEGPLEKGMATHSSIPAWRIPDRGAWWATVHGMAKSQTRLRLTFQICLEGWYPFIQFGYRCSKT